MDGWRRYGVSTGVLVVIAVLLTVPMFGTGGGKPVVYLGTEANRTVHVPAVSPRCTICVTANITVGSEPSSLAYDSGKGEVFVTNLASNNVSVISATTDKVVGTINVGSNPNDVVYDAAKGEVFVENSGNSNLSVISDKTNTVVSAVSAGSNPDGLAYDSGTGQLFVASPGSNSLDVISDATNAFVTGVNVGIHPWGVTYDRGKGEIFVANYDSNTVSVISDSTDAVVATVSVGSFPIGVTYDSAKGEVFVTNAGSNNLTVISDATNKVVANIGVGSSPQGVAYDGNYGEIAVTNSGTNNVSVVSDITNSVVTSISLGTTPKGVAYVSNEGEFFVANQGSNTISVIPDATRASVSLVGVGVAPAGLAYDSGKGEIFVANSQSNNVSVISDTTNKVIATVSVGTTPQGVAYDPSTGEVFVTNANCNSNGCSQGNVSVISDANNMVIATIPVQKGPTGVAYDSLRGEIFVANYWSNNICVISVANNTVIKTIPVGQDPQGVAYDAGKGEIFVANSGSNNVSVIADVSNTVVANIATGGAWGVAYDGGMGEFFVTKHSSLNNVSVVSDTNLKVLANISVGNETRGVAYDNLNGEVFVANTGTNNVSAISDATHQVVATYAVGLNPWGVAYDSGNGDVYVANSNSSSVSIISTIAVNSVSVTPSSATINGGNTTAFTAVPTCTSPCPTGVSYSWSLTKNLGVLSSSSGQGVTFTAGYTAGNTTLFVNATLDGGAAQSKAVPITVILLPLTANVTLSSYSVQNGTSVTATAHLVNSLTPTFNWTLNGTGPALCSSNSTCNFTLVHPAKYEVNLTVVDSGRTAWSQALLTVYNGSKPPPLQGSIALSVNDTYPGSPVWVNTTASGGQVPYAYTWTLNRSGQPWTSADVEYTPHGTGNYSFSVVITDALGQNTTRGIILTVLKNKTVPPPITIVLNLSSNDTHPGTQVWVNATASGGQSSYIYSWTENGTTYPGSTSVVTVTPKGSGNYSFAVTVSDSIGQKTTKGIVLTVLPSLNPLIVLLTANTTQVHPSGAVSLTGSITGGVAPYRCVWSLNGTNDSSLGTAATLPLTIAHPGNYTYQLWVADESGRVVSSNNVTIEVLPTATNGTHSVGAPSSFATWAILIVVVLAAVLLILLFFTVRRQDDRGSKSKTPPSASTWVPTPIAPKPPADYLEGISVAPAEWDESAEPTSAYGSYTVGSKENAEFAETASGTSAKTTPELDAYRSFSMKITPEGIQVEQAPKVKSGIVDAEFVSAQTKKEATTKGSPPPKPSEPSPNDVYAVMQSLARKPRSLDGLKQEVRIEDEELFAILGALTKAKLIARGTKGEGELPFFVLTPLGRKMALRFIGPVRKQAVEGELRGKQTTALPPGKRKAKKLGKPYRPKTVRIGKDTTLQDVHQIGKERESTEEASPFKTLRPEDVNPQLKGKKPLPKEILQPMEMQVRSDRGTDARDTTKSTDSDRRAQLLLERAKKDRKGKDTFGVQQQNKPQEKD